MFGIDFDHGRGHGIGNVRKQDKALAEKGEAGNGAKALQVNDNNAGKSKQAAHKFCFCKFFLPEQKACDQDGQK